MRTVAFHNLGCKVNSYESNIMKENLEKNNNVKYKLLFPAYHNHDISDEELIQKKWEEFDIRK